MAKYEPKHRRAKHRADVATVYFPSLPKVPTRALVGGLAAVAVAGGGTAVAAVVSGSPAPQPTSTTAAIVPAAARVTPAEHAARTAAVSRSMARPQVVGTPTPTPTPTPTQTAEPTQAPMPYVSPGSARAIAQGMMGEHGWDGTQFGCLDALWNRESHWNVYAANRSGAYGIPQALPGSKMGPGWHDSALVQITWGLGYIASRYGTPCGAWGHSQSTGWY